MVGYVDLSGILVKYSRTVDKDIDKVIDKDIDKDKTTPAPVAIFPFLIGEFVTFLKDSLVFVSKLSFNSWLEDSGLILAYLTN